MTKPIMPPAIATSALALSIFLLSPVAHAHGDSTVALDELHHINQAEIRAATLALQKTQSPDVKNFAQHLIDQHTAADKNVQTVADDEGVQLPTFQQADFESVANDHLGQLSGSAFDLAFLHMMKAGHKKALFFLSSLKDKSKDKELTGLAEKITPDVKEHEKMAVDLIKKIKKS